MRDNHEIITIIKDEMNKQDLSISELARRVDMAKSAVSRYLNETREFSLNRSKDFAKALHISVEYLLGFDESEQKQSQQNTIAAHFDKEDLTDEEKQEVQDFINYLKSKRK